MRQRTQPEQRKGLSTTPIVARRTRPKARAFVGTVAALCTLLLVNASPAAASVRCFFSSGRIVCEATGATGPKGATGALCRERREQSIRGCRWHHGVPRCREYV